MKSPAWFTQNRLLSPLRIATVVTLVAAAVVSAIASFQPDSPDARLTNDNGANGGYVSVYTLATGNPYTDPTLEECTISRGRQNEPAIAVDPRNTSVLLGSSNDYCGVYNRGAVAGAVGPIWLGYYRSTDQGASFTSSLVPGYPDDSSPYAALAHIRTASAGDPVIAWDNHGRVFMGSESSGDPALSKKTFGDVWVARFDNPDGENGATTNDGKRFRGSEIVAHGSSAPNLLGVFQDKTALEVDRTGGACDGYVYFAWARFNANGSNAIYLSRSTDHGASWSKPAKVTVNGVQGVQNPDIAVTGNGHVYVVFREFRSKGSSTDSVDYVKSTDCGRSFGPPQVVTTFTRYRPIDIADPQPIPPASAADDPESDEERAAPGSFTRDCGDFQNHCLAGYTFFRVDAVGTQVRATADQLDKDHEWVYIVYDPAKPGTEVSTGSSYFSVQPGIGGQAGIFFTRLDGATGGHSAPALIDNQTVGHQIFPDISADGGVLHALWWDSRNDPCYSPTRPIGNCADRTTVPSLDVWAAKSNDQGNTWTDRTRVTDVTSNPNYEQFDNRTIPFAGDYLWVTSLGDFSFGTWTDWRDTVQGTDPRELPEDEDAATADVLQCRTLNTVQTKKGPFSFWSGDLCPHAGGIDQNIYGDTTP
jgi:hypothetical protein